MAICHIKSLNSFKCLFYYSLSQIEPVFFNGIEHGLLIHYTKENKTEPTGFLGYALYPQWSSMLTIDFARFPHV